MTAVMRNHSFPRWSAPLIGIVVGAFCGLRAGLRAQIPLVWFIAGGAVIGGLAGSAILLLEPRQPEPVNLDVPLHLQRMRPENPSGVVGRFLALAGCLLCWFPILGFILNLLGYLVNRRVDDWAKFASLFGLVLGASLTTLFVFLLATGVID